MPTIVYTGFDSEYNPQYLVTDIDASETPPILKATSIKNPKISAITEELWVD